MQSLETHLNHKNNPQRPEVVGPKRGSVASSRVVSVTSQGSRERHSTGRGYSLLNNPAVHKEEKGKNPTPSTMTSLKSHSTGPMQQKSQEETEEEGLESGGGVNPGQSS